VNECLSKLTVVHILYNTTSLSHNWAAGMQVIAASYGTQKLKA